MLPAFACRSAKGHMAAMERLLAGGRAVEPSADELVHEDVAVKMVHREMREADEANLLEEEDMHVFDREPLSDRLPLVSCNTCKKPIKASQYSAHAERCRSLISADDGMTEIDGGANHKKPPRKARKKLLVVQDNLGTSGERERLRTCDTDDAGFPDSVGTSASDSQDQFPGRSGFTNLRGPKHGGAYTGDGSGVLRGSALYADSLLSPTKRVKLLRHAELDVMCGVLTEQGAPCRQSLTCKVHSESSKAAVTGRRRPYDVLLQELKASLNRLRSSKVHDSGVDPLPMTTKVYNLRHSHRMRAVLGKLFQEACAKDQSPSPSPSPSPSSNSVSGDQGAGTTMAYAASMDNGGQPLSSGKMQQFRVTPDGNLSQGDQLRGLAGGSMSLLGSQSQSVSRFSSAGAFSPNQYAFGRNRSASPLLGVGAGADFSVCLP